MTARATKLAVIPLAGSRLSDQTKVLAQRLGLVEQRLGEAERRRDRRRHIEAEAESGSTVEQFAEVRE